MRPALILSAVVLLTVAGCGGDHLGRSKSAPPPVAESAVREDHALGGADDADRGVRQINKRAAPADGAGGGEAPKPEAEAAPVARKIIYTATINLVVADFDDAHRSLTNLVESHGGFVARSDVSGSPGAPRHGSWTARVPVAKFRPFVDALVALGEATRNQTDSQDVTDEFYDTEARVKNKKVEEERLLEHLKKSTGKLEEILTVERELARVRGEIEQAQGRLQRLGNLSALTTVTVTVQERKDYVPPTAPSFGTSVGRSFGDSVAALVRLGQGLVVVGAALLPWLPLLAAAAWLGRRALRWGMAPARTPPA